MNKDSSLIDKRVGDIISAALKKYPKTQLDIADMLDISTKQLRNYANGIFPKYKGTKIAELDKILKTNAFDLLYNKEPKQELTVPRENMAPAYRHQLWFNKVAPDSETFVPLIPYKARAGYSRNYENVDYINSEFEPYQMPPGISPRGADWRWFEVGGTSMVPTLMPGDFLLCSLLPTADWLDIEQFKIHVIVWKSEVSVKRIAIKETGEWVLISENEEEEKQIKINLADIKEIWKVRRRITGQLPPIKRLKIIV